MLERSGNEPISGPALLAIDLGLPPVNIAVTPNKSFEGTAWHAASTMLRMIIRRLLGALLLTTSGCSSQSRRQASLPPVSLLIRSIGQ
jgi:hypothetical protein